RKIAAAALACGEVPARNFAHPTALASLLRRLDFAVPLCDVTRKQTTDATMFEAFKQFLSDVTEGGKHPRHFAENDYRLAAAALLVHAAAIDGNISEAERDKLHQVIKRRFDLDDATTDELVAEATEAEREAIDLYHFTKLINRSLDEDGRRRLV